jgi:hypothetical protein
MLIIALVLALIGLIALVFAVVTSNELVAWVCIGASVLGVVLLIVDALRERQGRGTATPDGNEETAEGPGDDAETFVDYPEEVADEGDNEPDKEQKPSEEAESAVPADGNGEDSAK